MSMTYTQVVSDAKQLSAAEKLDLVEALLRDLRQTVLPTVSEHKQTVEDKLRIVDQLGGSLKPLNGPIPTDDEIRDGYTEELLRKYLGAQP